MTPTEERNMLTTAIPCQHGFWLTDCALCLKRTGECDWGGCATQSTCHVIYRNATGRVVERRPMCDQHSSHISFGYEVDKEPYS